MLVEAWDLHNIRVWAAKLHWCRRVTAFETKTWHRWQGQGSRQVQGMYMDQMHDHPSRLIRVLAGLAGHAKTIWMVHCRLARTCLHAVMPS